MAAKLPALLGLTLVRDGEYQRFLPLSQGLKRCSIYRKKCQRCKRRFSILPNDVVPLHSYSLQLITSRLQASLEGQSDRSREFYEQQGLIPDDNVSSSWSDQLNEAPPRPSRQLFRHWRLKWRSQAHVWLQSLVFANIYAGCDLKSAFALRLQNFKQMPALLNALALAIGLIAMLQSRTVKEALPGAVFLLSCSPSHKVFLAGGRPPPQYCGAMEFP